jgi:hypothetical protein
MVLKGKKKFKDSWAEMRYHPVLYTDLCVGTDSDRMQMLFNLFSFKVHRPLKKMCLTLQQL